MSTRRISGKVYYDIQNHLMKISQKKIKIKSYSIPIMNPNSAISATMFTIIIVKLYNIYVSNTCKYPNQIIQHSYLGSTYIFRNSYSLSMVANFQL